MNTTIFGESCSDAHKSPAAAAAPAATAANSLMFGFVDEREYRAESERLWRVVAELTKPMARGGVKFGNNKDMGC